MPLVATFPISKEELLKIGASEDSVKFEPERGGGYMGMLEVHHQLHCLVRNFFPPDFSVAH